MGGRAVGDVGVVNGKIWPEAEVARGLYRLRLVNAASYSVWDLRFSNGMPFWVVGMEGGLLDAPAPTTHVRLAPGERVDLLVDFGMLDPGATVELRNTESAAPQAAQIGAVHMPMFLRFRAEAARGFTGPVPDRLRGGTGQPPIVGATPEPAHIRNVSLSQPSDVRLPPSIMSLNNLRFHSDDIEMPRQGTVEQWNIVNTTPDPHPIHLHLVHFRDRGTPGDRHPRDVRAATAAADRHQVDPRRRSVRRGTTAWPRPWETGYKDTVICIRIR